MSTELTELIRRRSLYRAAEEGILGHSQSYTMPNGRVLVRADLPDVIKELKSIEGQIALIQNQGSFNRAGFGGRD